MLTHMLVFSLTSFPFQLSPNHHSLFQTFRELKHEMIYCVFPFRNMKHVINDELSIPKLLEIYLADTYKIKKATML